MAWPNETSTTSGATPAGTAWRAAKFSAPGSTAQGNVYAPTSVPDGSGITLVVAAHGSGGSNAMLDTAGFVPVREALTDAGYVVVAASLGNTWGNQSAMDNLAAIYAWCDSVWSVSRVLLIGQSQGGGVMTGAAMRQTFPGIVALVGIAPAVNYQWVSDFGTSSATIQAAYSATAATFPAAIQGYGPLTGTAGNYAGLSIFFLASDADTTTPPNDHSRKFGTDGLAAQAKSFSTLTVTGGHLSADHYRAAEIASFFHSALNPAFTAAGDLFAHDGYSWVSIEAGAYMGGTWQRGTLKLIT